MLDGAAMSAVLTVEEFAEKLRISRSLAYRLVKSGEVRAVRLGTAWRVPRHVVDELLGRSEEDPAW
jgi:excisionase family DNA binding protein